MAAPTLKAQASLSALCVCLRRQHYGIYERKPSNVLAPMANKASSFLSGLVSRDWNRRNIKEEEDCMV